MLSFNLSILHGHVALAASAPPDEDLAAALARPALEVAVRALATLRMWAICPAEVN
jgi:hypothetical protein